MKCIQSCKKSEKTSVNYNATKKKRFEISECTQTNLKTQKVKNLIKSKKKKLKKNKKKKVAGVAGADLDPAVILVLGFANLVADGISMGVGDYLSEVAEQDFAKTERQREMWEFENHKEGEIQEMIEIYKEKGVSQKDAETILNIMAKYPDFFVDHMCVQELDIKPVEEGESPAKSGQFISKFYPFFFIFFLSLSLFPHISHPCTITRTFCFLLLVCVCVFFFECFFLFFV